jgi:hypothetical protein
MGAKKIPAGMQFWPKHSDLQEWEPDDVVKMYNAGFAGCYHDDEAAASLWDSIRAEGGWTDGEQACHAYGLADSAAGQLVATWRHVNERVFPGCWPASPQTRGDCVSHDTRNAVLFTCACDIASGRADEVTGKVEVAPEVPQAGLLDGVFSSEAIYWYRRHGGDGWQCEEAAQVVRKEAAMWIRQNYADLGFDLSRYSGGTAGKWGSSPPPDKITEVGRLHLIRTATQLNSFEAVRDMLANGYGISTCGGEGFSNQRDENGVSRQQGSWAHAMAAIGADDRDIVKTHYRTRGLVLILNSWGPNWNSGPRRVMGTNFDIPLGSFWARWEDVSRRSLIALSGANGWPRKSLPEISNAYG